MKGIRIVAEIMEKYLNSKLHSEFWVEAVATEETDGFVIKIIPLRGEWDKTENGKILFEILFSFKHGRTIKYNPSFKSRFSKLFEDVHSVFSLLQFNFGTLDKF